MNSLAIEAIAVKLLAEDIADAIVDRFPMTASTGTECIKLEKFRG